MSKDLKSFLKEIPVLGKILVGVSRRLNAMNRGSFTDTASYWESRYASGGNSGSGSYNHLANFKADVINALLAEEGLASAIEFGCGDGNQLSMISYSKYIGLDVSKTTIQRCSKKFSSDKSKSFYLYDSLSFYDNQGLFKADVSLSLDVIYHIIEDDTFTKYMRDVFNAGNRFVVIYSSNYDSYQNKHVKHRSFSRFVDKEFPNHVLLRQVKNPFEYSDIDEANTSSADFYIYKRNIKD